MVIYLSCFSISVLFAHMARKTNRRANFFILSVLSVLVTVCLAGFRDISVGIDTSNYYEGSWTRAISTNLSLKDYLQYYLFRSSGRVEVLYTIISYTVARMTGNYQVFLFVVHLIIIGCVYIGAFRLRHHVSPELTLLLFYLMYYNHSLNISRQYMAMAIIFAVVADIEKRKYLRYIISVAIAFFLHNTGILGLMPLLIYMVLYPKEGRNKVSLFRRVFTCGLLVGGVSLFIPLVRVLINAGVLSKKYLYYIDSAENSSYTMVLLFLMVEAVGIVLFWRQYRKNNENADFYMFCSLAFILFYQLAESIQYGKRIAAYFSFINIITLGMLSCAPEKRSNRIIVRIAIVVAVLVYWLYAYAYRNASRTMPYVLGI